MDPISLIITAIVAGALAATKETAGTAVKDSYQALKTLIKNKFAADALGQALLDSTPDDIKQAEALLKDKLIKSGADKDDAIIKQAQQLMTHEDPDGTSSGKYDLRGAKGVQIGDRNTQNNTFN